MVSRFLVLFVLVGTVFAQAAPPSPAQPEPARLSPEQTRAFIRDMADYVERWHLQKDQSPQRGIVHETMVTTRLRGDHLPETNPGQWGQWVQPVGGDTVHAAMVCAIGMLHAARATGDERYRRFVTDYSLPWMHRMITQSDTLFPEQAGTERSGVVLKIDRPLKGYVPFWWDEGQVLSQFPDKLEQFWKIVGTVHRTKTDLGDELRFNGYAKAVSQHMAQYIAVMLMETWWNTHDPRAAESAKILLEFWETASPWRINPVIGAAGATSGDEALLRRTPGIQDGEHRAAAWQILHGYAEKTPDAVILSPGFHDYAHFDYYTDLAKHGSRLSPEAARCLISVAYNDPLLVEYWSDTEPMPPGLGRYERAEGFVQWKHGAPLKYRSEKRTPFGVRSGTQYLVLATLALEALRQQPDVWQKAKAEKHPADWLVPSHPGEAADWSEAWRMTSGDSLEMKSHRRSLDLRGVSAHRELQLRISGRPGDGPPYAALTLKRDGSMTAVNHDGKPVNLTGKIEAKGDGFTFTVNIPYTANKGQNAWANGVDHGRYLIKCGGESRVAYLLTPTVELVAWLENHTAAALANLHAIFRKNGYLPYVIEDGGKPLQWGNAGPGAKISHLYGYAYVISAAAQHLLYTEGKSYWPVDVKMKP